MNKQKKILGSKGFSHAELLIMIVVIVAVGSVGWYVAKHKNTSHASSYTYTTLGTQPVFTVAKNGVSASGATIKACKVLGGNGTTYTVHGEAILVPAVAGTHYTFVLTDTNTANGAGIFNLNQSNWIGSTASIDNAKPVSHDDPSVINSIQGSVDFNAPSGITVTPTTKVAPWRAGSLATC